MYALVDCNSFYASCEKLFRPDLKHTAVVVLSNNDGCVIARSSEAKKLGIPMGAPYFKVRDECAAKQIKVFSSNYALYQDLSNRVMATLEEYAPEVDIYSIDEAFLRWFDMPPSHDHRRAAIQIKNTVYRQVGVPVGVGVGPTRTLSKLANHHAKKTGGVCVIDTPELLEHYLRITPVGDIWGIGRKLSVRLEQMNIRSAWELSRAHRPWLKKHLSVVVERTARELAGEVCLVDLDFEESQPKKQIVCSRSFGARVTDFATLRESICFHAARASEKLRKQGSLCAQLSVFYRTGRFNQNEQHISRFGTAKLINPRSDSAGLVDIAAEIAEKLWVPGYRYAKAGVTLTDFCPSGSRQLDLLEPLNPRSAEFDELSKLLDQINGRYGRGALVHGSQGINSGWHMSRDHASPAYTTQISGLPVVC